MKKKKLSNHTLIIRKKYKIKDIIDKLILISKITYSIGKNKVPFTRIEFEFIHKYKSYNKGYFNMSLNSISNKDKDLEAIKLPTKTSIIEINNNFYAINT